MADHVFPEFECGDKFAVAVRPHLCLKESVMISKFATVYAGHIDLPEHGQDAPPVNERHFSNEDLVRVFAKTEGMVLSQIFLMDERSPRGQIILFCQ
jgi:hypothetical protein